MSDKNLKRLLWILLALAIFFFGAAVYIPVRAMMVSETMICASGVGEDSSMNNSDCGRN